MVEITQRESVDAGQRLRAQLQRVLRRSLHIRHLDVGSCNGCDWEVNALLSPLYDVQRLGIDFVASPRHADLLLVTGTVTRNLLPALLAAYEAMPRPALVMAVGACAGGGGVFQGSYAAFGSVQQFVPVDVFVPGCPPRPSALIFGLELLLGRLQARVRQGRLTPN